MSARTSVAVHRRWDAGMDIICSARRIESNGARGRMPEAKAEAGIIFLQPASEATETGPEPKWCTPMTASPAGPSLPPPSNEVRAEALARAERLAAGLFPHQVEGLAFLLGRRRAILADDMGLGKTRQSIVALTEAAPTGPWLVVCPASVKRNWVREILAARPHDTVQIVGPADPPAPGYTGWVVINYDLLGKVDA